jgi:hypothetical protein
MMPIGSCRFGDYFLAACISRRNYRIEGLVNPDFNKAKGKNFN